MSFVQTEEQTKEVFNIPAKISRNVKLANVGENTVDSTDENGSDNVVEGKPFQAEIVWVNAIGFFLMHLAALYGSYLCIFNAKFLTSVWGSYTLIHFYS